MEKAKILIIDDEKLLRWSLEQNLTKEEYIVLSAESGMKGLKLLSEEEPDIVLLDIHLPDISGIDILEQIKKEKKHPIVIMITAFGDIETAVKAIKLGAYDFVEKPFNLDKLKILLSKAVETGSLRQEVFQFKSQLTSQFSMNSIVGQSDQMKAVKALVRKVSQSDASTIFLHGESGTGKDLIAKVIHYTSNRSDKPFMDINCTALPETLIESELFGYEKGAFTDAKAMKKGFFELADGGTIYLDEIADMKSSTQAKLLKVIENKTFKRIGGVKDIAVNIRVIASSNKNIEEEIKNGNFREDLYYRLQVIPLRLPPLRERPEDIVLLINAFINQFNHEFKKNVRGISKEAKKAFLDYHWPGNIRELKNVIERAMILENEEYILPEHLPLELSKENNALLEGAESRVTIPSGGLNIEMVEKELITQALEQSKWNQTKAAKLLNLTRDALRYRMQKFGIMNQKP